MKYNAEILRAFSVICVKENNGYFIPGGQSYRAVYPVLPEADFSQAAFWLCANDMGSQIDMQLPERSTQGDAVIRDIIREQRHDIDISGLPLTFAPGACRMAERRRRSSARMQKAYV